jgi:hypothetical protein
VGFSHIKKSNFISIMEVHTRIDESHKVYLDSMEYKNQVFTRALKEHIPGKLTVELLDLKTLNMHDSRGLQGFCKVSPITLCQSYEDGTKTFVWYFRPDDQKATAALKQFPEDLQAFTKIGGGVITDPMVLSVLYANICETYPFQAIYTICVDQTSNPKEYISLGIKKTKWLETVTPEFEDTDLQS